MKQSIFVLCASTAAATWGEWDSANYCDFNATMVDIKLIEADVKSFSTEECAYFCETADQTVGTIEYGTELCCDYQSWADGTFDCVLYETGVVITNDFVGDESGDLFESMLFASGDYNSTMEEYEEAVEDAMVEEGCTEECLNAADLTASLEAIAAECGCPAFMLRYNKAQILY